MRNLELDGMRAGYNAVAGKEKGRKGSALPASDRRPDSQTNQNWNRRPSCILRGSPLMLRIFMKFGSVKLVTGLPQRT
jgi:hypothetical protein